MNLPDPSFCKLARYKFTSTNGAIIAVTLMATDFLMFRFIILVSISSPTMNM